MDIAFLRDSNDRNVLFDREAYGLPAAYNFTF